jgi:hypothetical protein
LDLEEEKVSRLDFDGIVENIDSQSKTYLQLRSFLQSKDWQNADAETSRIVEHILGGSMNPNRFLSFSINDLEIIDKLWTKYSLGHYGPMAQFTLKRIIEEKMRMSWITFEMMQFYDLTGHTVDLKGNPGHKIPYARGHYPSAFISNQDDVATTSYLMRVQQYLSESYGS